MFSSFARVQRARIQADEAALAQVGRRLEHLQRAQDEANARLLDAQRAADALWHQTEELRSAERTLRNGLAETRSALLREHLSRVPEDVWRCVFEEAVDASSGTAKTPFSMAGVCAPWRKIALSAPRLWTRIQLYSSGTHPLDVQQAALAVQPDRVRLMVSRSGACPLHIEIWWFHSEEPDEAALRYMREALGVLADHSARWEKVALSVPGSVGRSTLDVLKGPTPRLVSLEVTITTSEHWSKTTEIGYLPSAPRLRTLSLGGTAIGCSTMSLLPALTYICLAPSSGPYTNLHLLNLLFRTRESLEEIVIDAWPDISVLTDVWPQQHGRPAAPIELPNLRSLEMKNNRGARPLEWTATMLLITPRLAHLTLGRDAMQPSLKPFLDTVSSSVRHLTLTDPLDQGRLEIARHLHYIEHLELVTAAPLHIDETAYAMLADGNSSPIWPNLAKLDTWHMKELPCDGLLSLISSRNPPRTGNQEAGRRPAPARAAANQPRRLREVSLGPQAPSWLAAEVERLLHL
ncbi:hypothetical protein AURDEDRAFT_130524 [Auricularia subglabra TFB-10046 SS5]|nr:hypothetical protein AURDEDRAFT_130524 [Auricularia subglabra TFB-10046 SS5]